MPREMEDRVWEAFRSIGPKTPSEFALVPLKDASCGLW